MPLLSLPDDVLHTILSHFLTHGNTLDLPFKNEPWKDHAYDNEGKSWREGLRDLRNLGLVSRTANEIATPYLYRKVLVRGAEHILPLLRTLVTRPDLATHVRTLAVIATPERWDTDEIMSYLQELRASAKTPWTNRILETFLGKHHEEEVACGSTAPETRDILRDTSLSLFRLPLAIMSQTAGAQTVTYLICYNYLTGLVPPVLATLESIHGDAHLRSQMLPRLDKLSVFEVQDGRINDTRWNRRLIASLLRFGHVRELWLQREDFPEEQDAPGLLGQVEVVRARGGHRNPDTWVNFLDSFPKLRAFDWRGTTWKFFDSFCPVGDLNEALSTRADTLRSVRVHAAHKDRIGLSDVTLHLGLERRLTCLPLLIHLTHLQTDMTALFASPFDLPELPPPGKPSNSALDLRNMLPASIKYVELASWKTEYLLYRPVIKTQMYFARLRRIIALVVGYSRAQLPSLELFEFGMADMDSRGYEELATAADPRRVALIWPQRWLTGLGEAAGVRYQYIGGVADRRPFREDEPIEIYGDENGGD